MPYQTEEHAKYFEFGDAKTYKSELAGDTIVVAAQISRLSKPLYIFLQPHR